MPIFLAATTTSRRPDQLVQFYDRLATLAETTDGPYYLSDCDGAMDWPDRGLYFFFSPDTDIENDPPSEWHLTRIGTVGVSSPSQNTLWSRLRQHRGNLQYQYAGGGNHRGSIFRRHVGRALIERDGLHDDYPHWGTPHSAFDDDIDTTTLREQEHPLEERVSEYIRDLPFLVVSVPGTPAAGNDRDRFETNSIALVSHFRRARPSLHADDWLGHESPYPEIYKSGLWNVNHIDALYSMSFLSDLDEYIETTTSPAE